MAWVKFYVTSSTFHYLRETLLEKKNFSRLFPSASDCGHVDRCWYHVREWLCIIFIRDDPLVWACRPQVKLQNNNKLSFNFTFLGQVIFLCLMDNFELSPRRQVKPTSSSSTPFFSSSPHYQHPQFYRPTNLKVSELLGCEPVGRAGGTWRAAGNQDIRRRATCLWRRRSKSSNHDNQNWNWRCRMT